MPALLNQMRNDYLLQVSIDYLHQETLEWISEIEFSKTELVFLSNLLNKAFLYAREVEKLNELHSMEKKVNSFQDKSLKTIQTMLILHGKKLDILEENSVPLNEQLLREEHIKNGLEVKAFMDSVKKIKKEIFEIVEVHLKETKKIIKDFEDGGIVL